MTERSKKTRIRKLMKQKESLLERAKEHREKAAMQKGRKSTTPDYWIKEAKGFEKQAEDTDNLIEKLSKKK